MPRRSDGAACRKPYRDTSNLADTLGGRADTIAASVRPGGGHIEYRRPMSPGPPPKVDTPVSSPTPRPTVHTAL
jgi:hypothetical protein